MTSGISERLGKASGHARRLLAVLLCPLATVALIAAGEPSAAARTRVGPQPQNSILTVEPRDAAGQSIVGVHALPLRPIVSATGVAADTAGKIPWNSYADYAKVTRDGREYAQVGDHLYTQHAVDRMQPSGLGAPAGADGPGRSISPNFVEDVIRSGTPTDVVRNGVTRTIYTFGSVQVVTEDGGRNVVTVNPFSGGG